MSDFNYYLNRQGPQGVQGPQGEEGFSPTVTINTNTSEEFTLLITNEDGSYVTPNLRGDQINNEGGTYVRYDQTTNTLYAGEADEAGVGIRGEVVLASDEDIELGTTGVVITADQFKEAMDALIAQVTPGNGQITIKQGGVVKGTFTVNQTGDTVIELVEGTSITVDSSLSTTSENPVQNKVITTALNNKANRSEIPDVSNFVTKTELEEVEAEIPDVSGFATSAALAQETSTRVSEDTRIENKVDSIVIPTVNDGQLTITQGGSTLGVFTANQSGNVTVDLPTGTTVNNGNLTINVNGTSAGSFSANQAGDSTVNITVPTSSADLSDGSTLVTTTTLAAALTEYPKTTTLATVATSGDYNDLSNKPTIPTVNDGTVNFVYGTTPIGSVTVNQSTTSTITIPEVSVSTATSSTPGIVQPDGVTITVDANGVISGAPSGAQIDDTTTSTSSVWSSDKTNTAIQAGDAAVLETVNENFLGNNDIIAGPGITISSTTTTTGTTENTQLTISSNVDVSNLATKSEVTTAITSATSTMVSSATVRNIVTITQADYDDLQTKEADTEYHITDAIEPALADLSNISENGKTKLLDVAYPDYASVIEQSPNTSYTATTNGYVYVIARSSGSAKVTINNTDVYLGYGASASNVTCTEMLPVKKGDVYYVTQGNMSPTYVRFFPAIGGQQ